MSTTTDHVGGGDRPGITRRTALGSSIAALSAGGFVFADAPAASAHGTLATHTEVDSNATYYEVNKAASGFAYNPTFYARLETWAKFYYINTPSTWVKPLRIYTYGVHNDSRVSTAHNNARGFDLAEIWATVGGSSTQTFSARYDLWRTTTGGLLTTMRRWYWGTAASCFYHFQYVLTYLYNTDHWNHIHIDNLVSGTGNSTFSTGSDTQVLFVQAALNYVWGYTAVTIDGVWGSQTSTYAGRALARAGATGTITTSQANWLRFCETTTRFGTGDATF